MIVLKNIKAVQSVVKINGEIVDDQYLPSGVNGHYNERVLDLIGEIEINGVTVNVIANEIYTYKHDRNN